MGLGLRLVVLASDVDGKPNHHDNKAADQNGGDGLHSVPPSGINVKKPVDQQQHVLDQPVDDKGDVVHVSPHHPSGRSRQVPINRAPQVQAELVQVHVVGLGRVVLDDTVVVIPEQALDEAHLFPCRAALREADAHVFPAHAIGGDHLERQGRRRVLVGNEEGAVVAVGFSRAHRTMPVPELFGYVHSHSSRLRAGFGGGLPQNRPVDIGAQVLAPHGAIRRLLDGWAMFGGDLPVAELPLMDCRTRHPKKDSKPCLGADYRCRAVDRMN